MTNLLRIVVSNRQAAKIARLREEQDQPVNCRQTELRQFIANTASERGAAKEARQGQDHLPASQQAQARRLFIIKTFKDRRAARDTRRQHELDCIAESKKADEEQLAEKKARTERLAREVAQQRRVLRAARKAAEKERSAAEKVQAAIRLAAEAHNNRANLKKQMVQIVMEKMTASWRVEKPLKKRDPLEATRQAEAQRWAHADFVDRPADAAQLKEERNRLAVALQAEERLFNTKMAQLQKERDRLEMARLGGQLQTNQQAGRYLSKVEHQREQRDRFAATKKVQLQQSVVNQLEKLCAKKAIQLKTMRDKLEEIRKAQERLLVFDETYYDLLFPPLPPALRTSQPGRRRPPVTATALPVFGGRIRQNVLEQKETIQTTAASVPTGTFSGRGKGPAPAPSDARRSTSCPRRMLEVEQEKETCDDFHDILAIQWKGLRKFKWQPYKFLRRIPRHGFRFRKINTRRGRIVPGANDQCDVMQFQRWSKWPKHMRRPYAWHRKYGINKVHWRLLHRQF